MPELGPVQEGHQHVQVDPTRHGELRAAGADRRRGKVDGEASLRVPEGEPGRRGLGDGFRGQQEEQEGHGGGSLASRTGERGEGRGAASVGLRCFACFAACC